MNNNNATILIVDDIETNRLILRYMLDDKYRVIEASDGDEALKILFEDKILPIVVLLDIKMPRVDGFEVLRQIKGHDETEKIPVLFITADSSTEVESRGLKAGAADYITKPFNHDVVRARVENHISLAQYRHGLEELVEKKAAEVTRTHTQTLEILATIIEYRNLESSEHIRRTTLLAETIFNRLLTSDKFKQYLKSESIYSMVKASTLHDIGKIGVPDGILLKPGKLTREEFEVIKSHTTIGARIVENIAATMPDIDRYLRYAHEICLCHHERWDGTGYPLALSGDKIPLSARVISVVDVYDALVNQRCYKDPFSHEASLQIIYDGRGTQFDPDIVDLVPELADEFMQIEDRYKD